MICLSLFNGVVYRYFVYSIYYGPIKDVIIVVTLFEKEVQEDLPEVGVVWLVLKSQ